MIAVSWKDKVLWCRLAPQARIDNYGLFAMNEIGPVNSWITIDILNQPELQKNLRFVQTQGDDAP